MNRMASLLFLVLLISCGQADPADGFIARTYPSQSGSDMPYRLFIPPSYDKSQRYPLILWLHGTGGRGFDNLSQIQGDQIPGTHIWTTSENQAIHPAFVVAPQTQSSWDSTGTRLVHKETDDQLTPELKQVIAILESLQTEFSIDPQRLYVAGQSLGGYGAWNLITKKANMFAAAIILCGGGKPELAQNAKDVPIWSFQGGADGPNILESNRGMVAALKQAGGNPRYTEYPGMGHEIWDRVFKEPELMEWLFAQHK
jgi:predicted peptidase